MTRRRQRQHMAARTQVAAAQRGIAAAWGPVLTMAEQADALAAQLDAEKAKGSTAAVRRAAQAADLRERLLASQAPLGQARSAL